MRHNARSAGYHPAAMTDAARKTTPANRLALDYRAEASRLRTPAVPIIDAHTHIAGVEACRVWDDVRRVYGVRETWSMGSLQTAAEIKPVLGDAIRFIAFPNFRADDRKRAFTDGFLEEIPVWRERFGATLCKFWNAPRLRDFAADMGLPDLHRLDHPWRIRQMELATSLGMGLMVHLADPDTWFQTHYKNASRYGTKRDQYTIFRDLLDRFPQPWLAAHMAGWPEDLDFLSELLDAHPNLSIDTSATKWQVRELSKHPRERLVEFFTRFRTRILFGSDIVTTDTHLATDDASHMKAAQASSKREAFDLYASRYYALRSMFETTRKGESPIADPDLAMVDPHRHTPDDAPLLRGFSFPADVLEDIYFNNAQRLHAQLAPDGDSAPAMV